MLKELWDPIWNFMLTTYFALFCTLVTTENSYPQCRGNREIYLLLCLLFFIVVLVHA